MASTSVTQAKGRMPADYRLCMIKVLASIVCAGLAAACSTVEVAPVASNPVVVAPSAALPGTSGAPKLTAATRVLPQGNVVGRNERLLVYLPRQGESYASIAATFLGSPTHAWQIEQANADQPQPTAGEALVVPLVARNPLGVSAEGAQRVPILVYHRIGGGASKMDVSPGSFESQLRWLLDHGYHVVRLSDLAAFLAGRQPLPPRSVVITFDDGYESFNQYAFPLLRKFSMPATLFVYSDFLGAPGALKWPQLEILLASGLVDVQAHSKSHRRLTERTAGETDSAFRAQLDTELRQPRALLERRLAANGLRVRHFAYPYGDADEVVLDAMRRHGYELGLTVVPGSNPFYASPLLLRRIMIYGEHNLEDFKSRLNGGRSDG